MKIPRISILVTALAVISASTLIAAPVESVDSSRARVAFQKVDAFLGEKAVADQLVQLGVTADQARARVAQLSEAQVEQLAAQIDTLQAGGTIEGSNPNPMGPVGCFFKQLGDTITHIFKMLFCWTDVP